MGFMDTVKKWFGSAKEQASEVGEKAKPMMDKAKDVAGDVGERAKPMMEKAGDMAEKAWEKTKDVAEDIKDRFDGDDEAAPAPPEGGGPEAGS
jgi:hypothetical protein